MMKYSVLVVCCMIVWCAEISTARGIPKYNFSISSLYNQTGLWYGEKIQLDHEGGNLWDVIVNYTSDDSKNSQSILIVDNKISPALQIKRSLDDKPCPPHPGYQLLTGLGYYKVHSESKSWYKAAETCEQEGAHLYIFNSKEEADAVGKLIGNSSTGNDIYWIGIHDQFEEGHYVTIFNETFHRTNDIVWRVDSTEYDDCGYLCLSSSVYCLDDGTCTGNGAFICEKEI